MGIQSARVTSRGLEMSKFPSFFPRPDCLPIRRRVKNGGVHLDTCLIPLCHESSSSVEFGSRKPPLENPLTHTTNSLPAPFARPPEVARRGLFLSAIFRTHPGPSLEPPEYRIGSRKPPLENPLMHTTNSLPAPFARPPSGPGEGGFFCQRFFARLEKDTSEAKAGQRWPADGCGAVAPPSSATASEWRSISVATGVRAVDRVSRRRRGVDSGGGMARAEALHLPQNRQLRR